MKKPSEETMGLLGRIFHKILTDTKILHGYYDITLSEAWYIEDNQKIPLDVMEVLAIDHYFILEKDLYNLTSRQANIISKFLSKGDLKEKCKLLKQYFNFIEEKMKISK